MEIHIYFHGIGSEIAGKNEISLNNIKKINELKLYLFENYPDLKKYTFQVAINNRLILNDDESLNSGDAVDIIFPYPAG